MAFYQATPHKQNTSRIEQCNGIFQLPKIQHGMYLFQYLQELGYGMFNGGKLQPLSFQEIKAWLDLSHLNLNYREVQSIKELSSVFVSTFHESSSEYATAPYNNQPLGNKLKDALNSYKK